MKTKQLILVTLFVGILLAGCKKTETLKTDRISRQPSEKDLTEALQLLSNQGVDLSIPFKPLTKASSTRLLEASASFSEFEFTLRGWFNAPRCLGAGQTYKIEYRLYSDVKKSWMQWGTKTGFTCLTDASTEGSYTLTGSANVIFLAQIYIVSSSGTTYLGYAYSNWLTLDNPW